MHLRPEFRNFRKKFFNKITKRVRQPASHLNEIAHFFVQTVFYGINADYGVFFMFFSRALKCNLLCKKI
ncbi:hypothetical protein CHK_3145 [Christensenella hongkongensis]|uniref:Uncharacterized protein n=1 Tax=Christensenella hongkongensis TaxID=270498 RepID=A0A0M2NGL4_9FIRM|nr:hypothetical protein CHK_3145 [Christensenella hongkongensis]